MSDKKRAILTTAVDIVQRDGYAALTMRKLAAESDIKLASLQYHFPNWDSLIEAIANHVLQEYARLWGESNEAIETASLIQFVDFIWSDIESVESARLWPQLRAWGLVEPRMQEMLTEIYAHYVAFLTRCFTDLGCQQPKLEALAMLSMLEGASVFVGRGATYFKQLRSMKRQVLANLGERFGEKLLSGPG